MKKEIQHCAGILDKGGTILYPTDTIWGIGCDATNPAAVEKVFNIKGRVDSKAMLVLVDSLDMIYEYVEEIPEMALEILDAQSPESHGRFKKHRHKPGKVDAEWDNKPLTIIYPGAVGLAENLVAADGSIGIRITSEPFSQELIRTFRKPLVSSSANLAGQKSPANFSEISPDIRTAVDHVANWNQDDNKKRKPSGILKVSLNGEIEVIRL